MTAAVATLMVVGGGNNKSKVYWTSSWDVNIACLHFECYRHSCPCV